MLNETLLQSYLDDDTRNTIEESALNGWVRGGAHTRELAQDGAFAKDARPNMRF